MLENPAFWKLHQDLPRQGVGADWCSREALGRLPPLRKPPTILDLGCGPGRQSIVLAKHFRTPVQAVDLCQPYLDQMMDAAQAVGVESLIQPRREDFTRLPDAPRSIDLIWSEGAAWVMGMGPSLECWAPLLRDRGVMVVSDCVWTTETPPAEAKAFWSRAYPGMTDAVGVMALARQAGLTVFDHFPLPASAWWDEYYGPLRRRIAALRAEAAADEALAAQLDAAEAEIALFEKQGDSYGYAMFLMRPSS